MKKERIETFTDGVIAIIITLMVLQIKLPELTAANTLLLFRHIVLYGLSFFSIAIIWLNHHNMFLVIEKVDTKTIWTNMVLLFFMSLLPIPTKALGEQFYDKESHLFFGAVMTAISITYSLLQTNISRTLAKVSLENKTKINKINWLSTTLYALSIPLSFVSVYLSTLVFVLVPVIYFIPSKTLHVKNYTMPENTEDKNKLV